MIFDGLRCAKPPSSEDFPSQRTYFIYPCRQLRIFAIAALFGVHPGLYCGFLSLFTTGGGPSKSGYGGFV
jgi:hypothetical protein